MDRWRDFKRFYFSLYIFIVRVGYGRRSPLFMISGTTIGFSFVCLSSLMSLLPGLRCRTLALIYFRCFSAPLITTLSTSHTLVVLIGSSFVSRRICLALMRVSSYSFIWSLYKYFQAHFHISTTLPSFLWTVSCYFVSVSTYRLRRYWLYIAGYYHLIFPILSQGAKMLIIATIKLVITMGHHLTLLHSIIHSLRTTFASAYLQYRAHIATPNWLINEMTDW